MNSREKFRAAIADYFRKENNSVTLFWKGRVALYSILKAMEIGEGDEVILPAFTCVVVPNAIIYAGASPIYVDIAAHTFNIDVKKIEEKISPRTKAILAQNTFGLSPDLNSILHLAHKHGLFVIEDCAHGFGGHYHDQLNGTIGDASFFSTQWNKPFSTGLGGIAITKHPSIAKRLKELEDNSPAPSFMARMLLSVLIFVREKLFSQKIYWRMIHVFRWLSKMNLIPGSSQGGELRSPKLPKSFLKKMSNMQARKGMHGLNNIGQNLLHRKKIANEYSHLLKQLGIPFPVVPDGVEHTFIKFPVLVKDRNKVMEKATKLKLEVADWMNSPIHPIQKNFERWQYHFGENPVAEKISSHIINLPTHEKISEDLAIEYKRLFNKATL